MIEQTGLPFIDIVRPEVHEDERGSFVELYNEHKRLEPEWFPHGIRQISRSVSKKNVFRGLHFQFTDPMNKAMRVVHGSAYIFYVNINPTSVNYLRSQVMFATAETPKLIYSHWMYANGWLALEENTEMEYFHSAVFNPRKSYAVKYDDPRIELQIPIIDGELILSERDRNAMTIPEWEELYMRW